MVLSPGQTQCVRHPGLMGDQSLPALALSACSHRAMQFFALIGQDRHLCHRITNLDNQMEWKEWGRTKEAGQITSFSVSHLSHGNRNEVFWPVGRDQGPGKRPSAVEEEASGRGRARRPARPLAVSRIDRKAEPTVAMRLVWRTRKVAPISLAGIVPAFVSQHQSKPSARGGSRRGSTLFVSFFPVALAFVSLDRV